MDQLKIYIDRLANDSVENFDLSIQPSYFEIEEKELKLIDVVSLKGSAYLANDHLIIELSINTQAQMPCSICNDFFPFIVEIFSIRLNVPISKISNSIYDLTDEVRNQILLTIPSFSECTGGNCSEREVINLYSNQKTNLPFSEFTL